MYNQISIWCHFTSLWKFSFKFFFLCFRHIASLTFDLSYFLWEVYLIHIYVCTVWFFCAFLCIYLPLVLSNLTIMCLQIIFVITIFRVHLASWICGFSFHQIWKNFLLLFFLIVSFLTFVLPLLSFWDSNYIYSKLLKICFTAQWCTIYFKALFWIWIISMSTVKSLNLLFCNF